MKRCIAALTPSFNTNRMVGDYTTQYYLNAHKGGTRLLKNGLEEAKGLSAQIAKYRDLWEGISVEHVEASAGATHPIRSEVNVTATVSLGGLSPDEVCVQVYHGRQTGVGDLVDTEAVDMVPAKDLQGGRHEFTGTFTPNAAGRCGFSVRVIPADDRLSTPFIPGLITWESERAHAGAHV